MKLFPQTNIDFISKRRFWYIVSIVVTLSGIAGAFLKGIEYGIDFAGGTEVQLKFQKSAEIGAIRSALEGAELRGAEVKYYGADESGVLIRVPQGTNESTATKTTMNILNAVQKAFPDNSAQLLQEQHIGPKIGAELQQKAVWAVIFTSIAILLYLAFRFRFVYGFGAIVAMVHDVLVAYAAAVLCNGIWPWLNLEMNSTLLASFLTIVGFSVNDTVIIFDRIREDSKKYKGQDLKTIMNRAINETMPRTIITTGTIFMTLLVLFVFGGEVLRGFAFTMLIGLITGTYSTIFVASSVTYDLIERRKNDTKLSGASTSQQIRGKVKKEEAATV